MSSGVRERKKINDEDDFNVHNVDVESLLLLFITIIRGIMRYTHKLKERHNVFRLIRREREWVRAREGEGKGMMGG